jgi:hypothetical protein
VPSTTGLVGGNVAAVTVSGPGLLAATVGELIGPLGSRLWRRSGFGSNAIDFRESVRREVCMADGPNQFALAVHDRDAFDEGGPKHDVRYLECRAAIEDDRVGGHHVRD